MHFSVVIPTRNRSGLLARALASVAAQDCSDWEVVVIDDGSSPDEHSRIAALVANMPRARLLRQDIGQGAPAARNIGIESAVGEWIATLDSDDWWEPRRLSRHRQAPKAASAVLSYNRAALTHGAMHERFATYGIAPPDGRAPTTSLAGWNYIGGCSSVCFSKAAFAQVGGFHSDLPSCQDWNLWLRLLQVGEPVFVDEVLTYQDFGSHERITSARTKVEAGHLYMTERAARLPMSRADRRYVEAHQLRTRAEIAHRFGDSGKALGLLLRSLAGRPTLAALRRMPSVVRGSAHRLLFPEADA